MSVVTSINEEEAQLALDECNGRCVDPLLPCVCHYVHNMLPPAIAALPERVLWS